MKELRKVAVGGTFDELHRGHKTLIEKAFEVGEKVVIGLTSDEFVKIMGKPHKTASYEERLRELKSYLKQSGVLQRAEIVPLQDAYGITIKNGGIEGLVVSKETRKTAQTINELRQKTGLKPLKIFIVDMVPAENKTPISTTRIRKGEIDRNGHLLKSAINF
ncbi:MAG: phosphopantetheine adenylyltransferase [Candidatus Bathyarchaeota archaeon]|nr:phosphopantetheine adenylyltransferase [Candidatus Bathyarchaeota archaeon]